MAIGRDKWGEEKEQRGESFNDVVNKHRPGRPNAEDRIS
jgi:hypothetical protein